MSPASVPGTASIRPHIDAEEGTATAGDPSHNTLIVGLVAARHHRWPVVP